MTTDIHIHIDDGLTQEDYRCFFANQRGSEYSREEGAGCRDENGRMRWPCEHQGRIWSMPETLAGESPWPFTGYLPETEEELARMPDPVGTLVETFPPNGELPVLITPERAERALRALEITEEDAARYGEFAPPERRAEIARFLQAHMGKGAFLLFH